MSDRLARGWFGSTALVAFVALATHLVLCASSPDGHFTSAAGRVSNQLFYFTIQSNLMIAVTTLLLAFRPARTSPVFRAFRLAGLAGIVITAVVYHAVLAGLAHLTGLSLVTDQLLHSVVPAMAVVGWLLFGPRRRGTWRLPVLSLAYPLLYLVLTLIRGPLVDWYPYPFVDVDHLGYPRVLVNSLVVGALFIAVAAVVTGVEGWLARRADRRVNGVAPVDAGEREPTSLTV
jgi:hypothetical protein